MSRWFFKSRTKAPVRDHEFDINLEFTPQELSGEEDPIPPIDPEQEAKKKAQLARSLLKKQRAERRKAMRQAFWQRQARYQKVWIAAALVLLVSGVLASWFAFPIREVIVKGNEVLSAEQIQQLAGATGGWLYYGRGAQGLLNNPWIQSAHVLKVFPDQVLIEVKEHRPVLRQQVESGWRLIAEDGTVLPFHEKWSTLPVVSGWGPERLRDAALVTNALSRYTVRTVSYTPSGLTVKTESSKVWTGDLKSFVKYARSLSMYPNKTIHIYPWGVSVQQ